MAAVVTVVLLSVVAAIVGYLAASYFNKKGALDAERKHQQKVDSLREQVEELSKAKVEIENEIRKSNSPDELARMHEKIRSIVSKSNHS